MSLRIALADIRHRTIGRHSVFMPIGIGYIASYALSKCAPGEVEIRLYNETDELVEDISLWRPDILGMANYCWNKNLSYSIMSFAKETIPQVICVAGGPEFPSQLADRSDYLKKRPAIDFFAFGEGERPFSGLVQKVLKGTARDDLRSTPIDGLMSIHPKTGETVQGSPLPPFGNLDVIPSPYLNYLMDKWFTGEYAPSIETTRGCAFTCGFCVAGQPSFSHLSVFSVERIREELVYVAQRMKANPHVLLSIVDSNFGMTTHDEAIAEYIREMQDEYGWPNAFDVTTGKMHYNRILHIAERLRNRMSVSCSVQSLNQETLAVIKRRNVPMPEYSAIQSELKRRGMASAAGLIVPMPMETKQSFFDGIKQLFNAGVENIVPYTTMLLKSTYLDSAECREKYKMQTRFRLLPRQFGEYIGRKCFEIEEVCVATSTMTFQEYLDCRGFAFVSAMFSSEQFDLLHRHLKELDLDKYDFLHRLWMTMQQRDHVLFPVYESYIRETCDELWESEAIVQEYFTKKENYEKLLSGALGDNLVRKYRERMLVDKSVELFVLCYDVLLFMLNGCNVPRESLEAAREWAIETRNLSFLSTGVLSEQASRTLVLPYDVSAWYQAGNSASSLVEYKKSTTYCLTADIGRISSIMAEAERLYGSDRRYCAGKILVNYSVKDFWSSGIIKASDGTGT